MGDTDFAKLLVISDHTIIRESIVRILRDAGFEVSDGRLDAFELPVQADVVLSIIPAQVDPEALLGRIRDLAPGAKLFCLFLSSSDEAIVGALRAGASGVIEDNLSTSFSARDLITGIKQVADGQFVLPPSVALRLARMHAVVPNGGGATREETLTPREREVLGLLAEGFSNRDIAGHLCLSEHTVRAHLRGIMHKLQVSSRAKAVAIAWKGNLVRGLAHAGKEAS
jgi:two-component system response regulator NreC